MTQFLDLIGKGINWFLKDLISESIELFATVLANIMGTSIKVLEMPLVKNGIFYAQALAFTILVVKVMNEAFQTYILYQNGDPDADPSGLLIRTAQAVAVIASSHWIIVQIFTFGSKVALDVARLGTGQTGAADWGTIIGTIIVTNGIAILIVGAILLICLLIVAFQATIRGAELALMAVVGPILALNITSNNRNVWSSYFKQLLILCVSQALQIFMLEGAFALVLSDIFAEPSGILLVLGWIWVAIKTPKFLQQFAHSTGFTGAVGGGAKQAGSMYFMRKMMAK